MFQDLFTLAFASLALCSNQICYITGLKMANAVVHREICAQACPSLGIVIPLRQPHSEIWALAFLANTESQAYMCALWFLVGCGCECKLRTPRSAHGSISGDSAFGEAFMSESWHFHRTSVGARQI